VIKPFALGSALLAPARCDNINGDKVINPLWIVVGASWLARTSLFRAS
jgi:hypothetical protein